MGDLILLISSLLLLWIIPTHLFKLFRSLKVIKSQPGSILLIRPFRLLSEQIPPLPFNLSISSKQIWSNHFSVFEALNSSVIVYLGLNDPTLQYLVADAEGSKLVLTNRRLFGKPVEDYGVLKVFGANVVASEGESWRRHRRLTSPSFSEKNNEQVWKDSSRVMEEWFSVLDSTRDPLTGLSIDSNTSLTTLRITLMIISSAAFGQQYSWPKPGSTELPPPGRKIAYPIALQGAVEYTLARLILPKFVYKLPFLKTPTKVELLFTELEGHFRDMITSRRNEKAGGIEHTDLFSALLKGVIDEEGSGVLTDEELLGNMYIFLLAGHETTAHTLAFALTLLALYPEHQQILFEEANERFTSSQTSSYSDYSSLTYTMATIQESLRMYPPVIFIPKIALEDCTIPATTTNDLNNSSKSEIFVPRGSRVGVMTSSLHYNPAYWKDPFTFNPTRFLDKEGTEGSEDREEGEEKWNKDAWAPFSAGGRGCLGIKFALVEMVVMISHLCLNYTIHIPTNLVEEYKLKLGETERERRERILKPNTGITLTPGDLPLGFKRRT